MVIFKSRNSFYVKIAFSKAINDSAMNIDKAEIFYILYKQ